MAERNLNQIWGVAARVAAQGPLDEVYAQYMARQEPSHAAQVAESVALLPERATESFRDMSRVQAGIGMLVSYQEGEGVELALNTYLRQRQPPRHRVVALHNWPEDATDAEMRRTRTVIDRFIDRHPQIPLAYFESAISEPLRMGSLRRLVTDVLLGSCVWPTKGDIMLTNHDADQRRLSPGWLHDTNELFHNHDTKAPFVTVTTHVTHVREPRLPNMNGVLNWEDHPKLEDMTHNYYEPGPCWSARAYMEEGFNPDDNYAETHNMLNRHHPPLAVFHPLRLHLQRAVTALLPRRQYFKMYQGQQEGEFWSGKDNDLTADMDYRRLNPQVLAGWPDIGPAQRDAVLSSKGRQLFKEVLFCEWLERPLENHAILISVALTKLEYFRSRIGGPDTMFEPWIPAMHAELRNWTN